MRVGYYWGGNGKVRMEVDLRSFAADLYEAHREEGRECLMPFSGKVSVRSDVPKGIQHRTTTTVTCTVTEICIAAYLKQSTMIRNCVRKFQQLMESDDVDGEPMEERKPFRAHLLQCYLTGGAVKVQLRDDRAKWLTNMTIASLAVEECNVHYRSEQRLPNTPLQHSADFSGALRARHPL